MAKSFQSVIFDEDFILGKELRALGFRKSDLSNEYLRIQDKVHGHLAEIDEENITLARHKLKDWKLNVQSLLSRPVGRYAHRKRPHRNLLPMMNSGELKDLITVDLRATSDAVWSYTVNVKIKSKHATFTNENITRLGRSSRKVAWKGWADSMISGNGLKKVPSVRNLMRSMFR